MKRLHTALLLAISTIAASAADSPQWCGSAGRNMVSTEKGLPSDFSPGKRIKGTEDIDPATTKNLKWWAKLGSQSYGTPSVSGGRVLVGTNNEVPRNPKVQGDRGVLMSFEEKTGKFEWQLAIPKLGAGKVSDWEYLGLCSTPTIEGDRAWFVTNKCEVVCVDIKGQTNGNDGPFMDEAKYFTPLPAPNQPPPPTAEVGPQDGDVIWKFDMRDELGVFPHNITSSSVVIEGDKVFVVTSNGVDWTHTNLPAPQAPTIVCLNKKTGELLGEETAKIGERTMHCNWSSPALGELGGKKTVVFGAGDGFTYGFNPEPKKVGDTDALEVFWKFDCVPPEYRADQSGAKKKYAEFDGPSEIIGTPVVHNGRVYISIGQDPEHGEGVGCLSCIDGATGKPVWQYKELERSISTVSIADGLLYTCDYSGRVHCLDAETGKKLWVFDTKGHIWGSTLVADGKIYVGNEEGELNILAAGREMKKLATIEFPAQILACPVAANGVLYITTMTHLYAFSTK